MIGQNQNFELLDILTIVSFCMQLQNQAKIIDLHDFQDDNNRIAQDIHAHLEQQDKKINRIMGALELEV